MEKFKKISLTFIFLLFTNHHIFNIVKSGICTPHDPNGENPDSLCIKHYHQNFGNEFQRIGNGSSAFYGKSNDLRYPGKKVISNPLQSDFFTNVSAGDKSNGVIIKTSKGKIFTFESE